MRDQDTFCLVDTDLFNGPARELIFRVMRPYLAQEGITATELIFNRGRQRTLSNDGNRLADAIQRVATLQSKQTRQPVLDRRRELTAIVNQALRLIDSLTRRTPSDFVFEGGALSQLCRDTADQGLIRTAIIIAAKLSNCADWGARIALCLDLLDSGAEDMIALLVEQTLAELLRLEPAGAAFGFTEAPSDVIDASLAMADITATVSLPMQQGVQRHLKAGRLGDEFRDALCDRISDAFDAPAALIEAGGLDEWHYLLQVKRRIESLPGLADDPILRQALSKRFLRLAQPEQLNITLAGIAAFGKKVLYLAQLYVEVQDGQARRDLLTALTFCLEHRDFTVHFAEPGTSVEGMFALAQTLQEALENPELPDHRRERFRNSILKQYMEIKRWAERRRDPRVVGGPHDKVQLNGLQVPLRNWSHLGVLFGPVAGQFQPGDTLDIAIQIQSDALEMQFDASADIVRVADGMIAARYYCRNPEVADRIRNYFGK